MEGGVMQEDESGRDSGRAPEQGRPEAEHRSTEASARGADDSARSRAGDEAPHADASGRNGPGRSAGGNHPGRSRGETPGPRTTGAEPEEAALPGGALSGGVVLAVRGDRGRNSRTHDRAHPGQDRGDPGAGGRADRRAAGTGGGLAGETPRTTRVGRPGGDARVTGGDRRPAHR